MSTKNSIVTLLEGTEISDDAKVEISTIFEAAISEEVVNRVGVIEEELRTEAENKVTQLAVLADEYITEAAKEWLEENRLVVEDEKTVKSAKLFLESIQEAATRLNLVLEGKDDDDDEDGDDDDDDDEDKKKAKADAKAKSDEDKAKDDEDKKKMEESVANLTAINSDLQEQVKQLQKAIVENALSDEFEEATAGLSEAQIERMRTLAESINYKDVVDYRSKLDIIKGAFIEGKQSTKIEENAKSDLEANPDLTTDVIVEKAEDKGSLDPLISKALMFADGLK